MIETETRILENILISHYQRLRREVAELAAATLPPGDRDINRKLLVMERIRELLGYTPGN